MHMLTQNYFSIDSLSTPWSHDQYSESRFKQQPSAMDRQIKNTENLKKTEDINIKPVEPSILARIKSNTKRWPSVRTIYSYPKVSGRALRRGKGEKIPNQTKTKQETVEKLLTGSAVNGMHFSIQVTHPCRTSKTGLESLPYSHRLRLLWSHWGCLE